MKLIGLMRCRNESWIIGLSLRVALTYCDHVIVYFHACTDADASWDAVIAAGHEYPGRVAVIVPDNDPKWDEMRHLQALLELGRIYEGTHFAIIDADEIAPSPVVKDLARAIAGTLKPGEIASVPMVNLRGTTPDGRWAYHMDGVWGNRVISWIFADSPALHWSGDRLHAREPIGSIPVQISMNEPILHAWGLDVPRLIAKHRLYKITERIRWPDKPVAEIDRMYSWAIRGGTPYETCDKWAFCSVQPSWIADYHSWIDKYVDLNQRPWQIDECWRLIEQHGREHFADFDLFEDLLPL